MMVNTLLLRNMPEVEVKIILIKLLKVSSVVFQDMTTPKIFLELLLLLKIKHLPKLRLLLQRRKLLKKLKLKKLKLQLKPL